MSIETAAYFFYQKLKFEKKMKWRLLYSFLWRLLIVNIAIPGLATLLAFVQWRPYYPTDLLQLEPENSLLWLIPLLAVGAVTVLFIMNCIPQIISDFTRENFTSEYIQDPIIPKIGHYSPIQNGVKYFCCLRHLAYTLMLFTSNEFNISNKVLASIISVPYLVMIIGFILLILFLAIRACICISTFLICYSNFFAKLIILTLPFIVSFTVIIQSYLKMKDVVACVIKKCWVKLHDKCQLFIKDLNENEASGEIVIYVRMTSTNLQPNIIEVDVPEMLFEIKDDISNELSNIEHISEKIRYNKNYKITVQYKYETETSCEVIIPVVRETSCEVIIPEINEFCFYHNCKGDLENFRRIIKNHLSCWDKNTLKSLMDSVNIYYDVSNAEDTECFGIKKIIYDHIYSKATPLNEMFYSVLLRIVFGICFYIILIWAIFVFEQIDSYIIFITTISRVPVSLAVIAFLIGYIIVPNHSDKNIKKDILEVIFKFNRGYSLFQSDLSNIENANHGTQRAGYETL